MKNKEFIKPKEAAILHKEMGYGYKSYFAIVEWVKRYGLGVKVGGRWKVDKEKFINFLEKGTYEGDNNEGNSRKGN